MGKIVYIMGKSSTGKDTIYRSILSDKSIKLKKIIPYTTRPIRLGEENGVQYYFTDEEGFAKLCEEGKVIEHRSYDTCYGLWRYFTVNDGVRLQRALNREKKQKLPKYEEMCRRYLADSQDFCSENIKKAGITKSFCNDNLKHCTREIIQYIENNL